MTLSLLKKIFDPPTAPFREGFVLETIESVLEANHIPYHYDKTANLIAGWNGEVAGKKKIRLGFIAHTDHPGFHVQSASRAEGAIFAVWLGGAPFKKLKNARVRIYSPSDRNWSVTGTIIKSDDLKPNYGGVPITIRLKHPTKIPKFAFGAFDYPGCKIIGKRIITRAADDLAGCVIQLGALLDTFHHFPGKAIAVFTRAEEVGYIGCLNAIKNKSLPKVPFISLEASKELDGARIGNGPVLRLGDRASLFDTSLSQALFEEANKLAAHKSFMFQRRIMDGGVCEATPLNLLGYRATGISVPLGNYHNQTPKGQPGPEIINIDDVDRARRLCGQLIRHFEPMAWENRMKKKMKDLVKSNRFRIKFKVRTRPSL